MHIHQVNVSYDAEQDRLLLRINSLSREEFRAWLTRRMTLKLLPQLGQTAQEQLDKQFPAPIQSRHPPTQQQLVAQFHKEAAVYDGDFQTPFIEKASALPLGEAPLLVTELTITPLADAKLQLVLLERLPEQQRDLQLVMDPALTRGLLRLLNQSMRASAWLDSPLTALAGDGSTRIPVRGERELVEGADPSTKPRYLN